MANLARIVDAASRIAPEAAEAATERGAQILEELGMLGSATTTGADRAVRAESAKASDFVLAASTMQPHGPAVNYVDYFAWKHGGDLPYDQIHHSGDHTALLATGDGYLAMRNAHPASEVHVLHISGSESAVFNQERFSLVTIKAPVVPDREASQAVPASPPVRTLQRYWGPDKGLRYLLSDDTATIGGRPGTDGQIEFALLSEAGKWNAFAGTADDWLNVAGNRPILPKSSLLSAVDQLDATHSRMHDIAAKLFGTELDSDAKIASLPKPEPGMDHIEIIDIDRVRYEQNRR